MYKRELSCYGFESPVSFLIQIRQTHIFINFTAYIGYLCDIEFQKGIINSSDQLLTDWDNHIYVRMFAGSYDIDSCKTMYKWINCFPWNFFYNTPNMI